MEEIAGEQVRPRQPMLVVAAASFVGAVLEWYDFFLYGTASALIFGKLFFPKVSPGQGTLLAFATFGVGFLTRPLGGIIFGHYGDKIGRKAMLIITIVIMGTATFLIGCLPTYATIGVWAPILLTTLRLLQGLGLGGEYGGAALMTIEHAPRERRGFWAGVPQSAASAGILMATGVFSIFSLLPKAQFLAWGWRIPFLLSVILLGVGLVIRVTIAETPAFERMKQTKREARMPVLELLSRYPRNVLLTLGMRLAETVSSNIFNAFAIAYIASQLKLSNRDALMGILIASAVGIVACPTFGAISDRFGRRPLYMVGAAVAVVMAFPFFMLLDTKEGALIYLAILIGYIFAPTLMFAVESVFFAELFGTSVRYSGLSVAYQVSAIIGGLTPFVASALLIAGGGAPWLVSGFLFVIALISLVCTYLATETFKGDVEERGQTLVSPRATPEVSG